LPSKIITGNNQDSIAVYREASVRKKVGSHILALMAEKRSFFRYYWLRFYFVISKNIIYRIEALPPKKPGFLPNLGAATRLFVKKPGFDAPVRSRTNLLTLD
jgi:hypothetical protein